MNTQVPFGRLSTANPKRDLQEGQGVEATGEKEEGLGTCIKDWRKIDNLSAVRVKLLATFNDIQHHRVIGKAARKKRKSQQERGGEMKGG